MITKQQIVEQYERAPELDVRIACAELYLAADDATGRKCDPERRAVTELTMLALQDVPKSPAPKRIASS